MIVEYNNMIINEYNLFQSRNNSNKGLKREFVYYQNKCLKDKIVYYIWYIIKSFKFRSYLN